MADDPKASAITTSVPGRFNVSVRNLHFVADASTARGGPGEALGAAELALSSLATCGLALVMEAARKRGDAVSEAVVETTYTVDASDTTRFSFLGLKLRLTGVDRAAGDALLHAFTGFCPIWNTLARTTPHESVVEVLAPPAIARAA